jgi:hypothetical protein
MMRSRHKICFVPLVLLALCGLGFSQTERPVLSRFRHERVIAPGGAGPNRLLIDPALLAGGDSNWIFSRRGTGSERAQMIIAEGGLKDLRLYDASNREIPYLLILPPEPEPAWIDGRLAPLALTKKTSGFEVDLGRSLLVDRLQLSGIPAPFVKRCFLEGSDDASRWTLLRADATVFDLPLQKLTSLEVEFGGVQFRYLRVTWDDRASARVPLPRAASVRLVSAGALPPRVSAAVKFERRQSEPGISRYRLKLPGARLPITEIVLSAGGGNVLREARVTEAHLSGGEMIPNILGTATLRQEVRGDVAAAQMSISVMPPQEAQLDLVIEDGNNPPLKITDITATFAHLPWIYFESEDEKPLAARFGYPNLKKPRYDLEAARESAAKAQTFEARWGEERTVEAAAESPSNGEMPAVGSAIDTAGFRFARNITGGQPGLCVLPLDPAVLAHSRISDLRIAGGDKKQIPYLIERADEPLSLNLPPLTKTEPPRSGSFARQNENQTNSYYLLRLPYTDLPSARLVFTTTGRVFRRSVVLLTEKNPFNERQEPWSQSIATATWSHADPETEAPALVVAIPPLKTAEAMVIVEEGDNSPLPIASVKLLLPTHRLRFFQGDDAGLKLYYGRSDLGAPRYDLAILAPRLVGAPAVEVQLSPEAGAAAAEPRPMSMKLFWGILIAAVLALLFLIARLLKKGTSPPLP